ncbi:hypothetical protein CYLTODRAFT_460242 [Cylindrobasidium torrendii FP15055 ss-10]|uniref:Uncharacterized protein n=1 Tax=Cylindrobasidium torrendii FP15055 ss-10 TaxID=1314674 RepID=A0A0D7ARJ8_9AGAR|nr:hypothetical protein CYLTODRAFT_460242 [Cylindrobasidium torrendii FP15055 ss-10]
MNTKTQRRKRQVKIGALQGHHFISPSVNEHFDMYDFVNRDDNAKADPARAGFIRKLHDHLVGRLRGEVFDGDTAQYTQADPPIAVPILKTLGVYVAAGLMIGGVASLESPDAHSGGVAHLS